MNNIGHVALLTHCLFIFWTANSQNFNLKVIVSFEIQWAEVQSHCRSATYPSSFCLSLASSRPKNNQMMGNRSTFLTQTCLSHLLSSLVVLHFVSLTQVSHGQKEAVSLFWSTTHYPPSWHLRCSYFTAAIIAAANQLKVSSRVVYHL